MKLCIILSGFFLAANAWAKPPAKIWDAVTTNYPPALPHRALETAYDEPDPTKMRGFVVLERGGIPAEKARFFISWDDYDYRGVVVHLDKAGEMTTRRGTPYTYLKRGDVMAVAGVKYFGGTIYFNLLSNDIYIPENRQSEKRHSRVTVALGFRLPRAYLKEDNAEGALKEIGLWLKPFSDAESAKVYAAIIKQGTSLTDASGPTPKGEDEKMRALEEKIESAKKEIEEAEREMKRLKGGRKR